MRPELVATRRSTVPIFLVATGLDSAFRCICPVFLAATGEDSEPSRPSTQRPTLSPPLRASNDPGEKGAATQPQPCPNLQGSAKATSAYKAKPAKTQRRALNRKAFNNNERTAPLRFPPFSLAATCLSGFHVFSCLHAYGFSVLQFWAAAARTVNGFLLAPPPTVSVCGVLACYTLMSMR